MRVLLGNMAGDIVAERLAQLAPSTPMEDVVATAAHEIDTIVAAHPGVHPLGACAGLAGPLSPSTGQIVLPTLLAEWFGVDAAEVLTQALGMPVILENDANLGAIAEAHVHPSEGDLVYIKAGTGVGAGIILDGRLRRGVSNTAGEIGHVPVDPRGEVCRCGNRGCVETVASVSAIMSAPSVRFLAATSIDEVVDWAIAGDVSCTRVLADAGAALGIAAAIACTVLNPGHIVVGGPIMRAGEIVLGPLRDSLLRHTVPSASDATRVSASVYGDRAPGVGALILASELFAPDDHDSVPVG